MNDPTEAAPVCYRHPDRETWIRCQRCDKPICPDCMTPAAVGFQCPSCVKDGSKGMRTGRLPYGGQASANPSLVSMLLIGINAAVWLAITATGGATSRLVDAFELLPRTSYRVLASGAQINVRGVSDGAYWQVLTSAFTHISLLHIGSNMLALYFLGPGLEQVLGRVRFIALYLVSALTGSAAVMLFSAPNGPTLGASGAIFGLFGALIVIAIKVRGDVRSILVWLGLNLYLTFSVPGISWQGHLGGLFGGSLIALAFVYAPKNRRPIVQWGAVGLVSLASVVVIVVRAHALSTGIPFTG